MSEQDPELDPEQERHVRDLLAGLRSDQGDGETLPPEVALRLDDTLAGLVAKLEAGKISEEHSATGTVVPLRPRWMPRVAAAAAAVIVLGLGALTAANLGGSGGDSATSSGAGAGSAGQAASKSATGSGSEFASAAAPDLRAATFAQDVRRLLVRAPALRVPGTRDQEFGTSAGVPAPTSKRPACPGPSVTDGSSVTLVSLDGRSAALVVHPAKHGKRLVEAWSCDGTHRLASTTAAP